MSKGCANCLRFLASLGMTRLRELFEIPRFARNDKAARIV